MFWIQQATASTFMPIQGTEVAAKVDRLYEFLLIASFISCVLVIGGLIYFALKYRRRSETDKTAYISHNALLEFAWSFIPFVIFMVAFGWGWYVYHHLRKMPQDALEIHVLAQKWSWNFTYKSGKLSVNDLVVPSNRPVKLIMTSKDVIHSFYIPAFRTKQDVVPGRYTSLAFEANKEGIYNIFCTEFCGDGHASMLAKIQVVPAAKFDGWLSGDPSVFLGDTAAATLSLPEQGLKLYNSRSCVACHSTTDEVKIGPGLKGVYGHPVKLSDGSTVTADDDYIRQSILNPQAKIVAGFEGKMMTTYQGQLTEEELTALLEFIKTLK